MAYCKRCGAYIPDGLSACLACGFDEAAEAAKQGGSAYAEAREQQNEDYRIKYEEERRKRQEENRQWAERERQRREEEEERRHREAEQEAQRRAEQEARARTYAYRAASGAAASQGKNRVLAALSYLSILWLLPRFLCSDDAFARYHSRQGLVLFVFGIVSDAVSAAFPGIGWVFSLFRIYCIYKGMNNALNDRAEPLPYIGQFGEKE